MCVVERYHGIGFGFRWVDKAVDGFPQVFSELNDSFVCARWPICIYQCLVQLCVRYRDRQLHVRRVGLLAIDDRSQV